MTSWNRTRAGVVLAVGMASGLTGCHRPVDAPALLSQTSGNEAGYRIGPGDSMQIFVWRNPELSMSVHVRPDGRISVPLIEDLPVANKTPTEVARTVEEKLSVFIKNPVVTIIMDDFIGPVDRQIRVVGEAAKPLALPFRQGITVLDVMIQAGGLTQFAAGNRALILRRSEGQPVTYHLRLSDLMKDGDLTANVELAPGDILMIPQSWL